MPYVHGALGAMCAERVGRGPRAVCVFRARDCVAGRRGAIPAKRANREEEEETMKKIAISALWCAVLGLTGLVALALRRGSGQGLRRKRS